MKVKIGDIFIIMAIIIIAIIIFPKKESADTVVIEVDGKVVKQLQLNKDCSYTYSGNYTNVIVVKNGKIYIDKADCPDKTCVKSGAISKKGQMICCLPNKMLIRVVESERETDVITG